MSADAADGPGDAADGPGDEAVARGVAGPGPGAGPDPGPGDSDEPGPGPGDGASDPSGEAGDDGPAAGPWEQLTHLLRPENLPSLLREHAGFIAVVVLLEALLVWLSTTSGFSDVVLLSVVPVLAVGYKVIMGYEGLERNTRETLVTLLFVVGLLAFMGSLSRWSAGHLSIFMVSVLIFALFALGLNLEFGFTGIINFGHVVFMGIGAYVTALVSKAWLPLAADLTEPSALGLGMVAGSALLVFVVVGVLGNALATMSLRRWRDGMPPDQRRRLSAGAGGVAGALGAVALVWTVSFPLEPHWATAFVVGAAVLVGMAVAAGFGIVLGIPTLRLREDYLAIVTIGAAEIVRRFWLNEGWLTNGPQGITGFGLPIRGTPQDFSFPLPLTQTRSQWEPLIALGDYLGLPDNYKLVLLVMVTVVLVLVYALYELLVRSPYGRVLKAIREDEEVAGSLGKNVFAYKLQALALGSAVAALAGAFIAWQNVYISPQTFIPVVTFYAWVIIVLGGVGNNKGVIVGSLILWTFFQTTNFLRLGNALGLKTHQEAAVEVVVVGVLLIAFMLFKPEGLLGRREEMVLGD